MNIRALQYFVKLAELRHFSNAASACFVSQPTLSTQIQKLEDELGVTLVERTPRQIMLTPIGEDIAHHARHVLRDIEHIKDAARRSRDPETGTIKLGIFPTLAPYLLPHVIPAICKKYPELRLQLAEEKTEDILNMLDQEVDPHSGELSVFRVVRNYPSRMSCVICLMFCAAAEMSS